MTTTDLQQVGELRNRLTSLQAQQAQAHARWEQSIQNRKAILAREGVTTSEDLAALVANAEQLAAQSLATARAALDVEKGTE